VLNHLFAIKILSHGQVQTYNHLLIIKQYLW